MQRCLCIKIRSSYSCPFVKFVSFGSVFIRSFRLSRWSTLTARRHRSFPSAVNSPFVYFVYFVVVQSLISAASLNLTCPDLPDDPTRAALNDLLIRLRLRPNKEIAPPFFVAFVSFV